MRQRPLRWRFGAKRFDTSSVAFTVDGQDLVHVCDIDANGNAYVVVYESTDTNAMVLFSGRINIAARKEENDAPVQSDGVHRRQPLHRAGD